MKLYSKTDIGKKRYSNQDAVAGKVISDVLAWTVVCDGMGGSNGGDIASKIAVTRISEIIEKINQVIAEDDVLSIMKDAVRSANRIIFEKAENDEILHGMGTTVVLAVVFKSNLYVLHAGDSRAYILTDSGIQQISVDHSVVQEMVDSGEITSKEARHHLQKNIITRALGIGSTIKLDCNIINLKNNDVVLICTDGLSNHLEDNEIYKIFQKHNLEDVAKALIDKCNSRGGNDNITVSLIKYEN